MATNRVAAFAAAAAVACATTGDPERQPPAESQPGASVSNVASSTSQSTSSTSTDTSTPTSPEPTTDTSPTTGTDTAEPGTGTSSTSSSPRSFDAGCSLLEKMSVRCTLSAKPPTDVDLVFTAAHAAEPRVVRLTKVSDLEVDVPMLTADTVWAWSAVPVDDPAAGVAGELTTEPPPLTFNLSATVEGEPVAPFVLVSAACADRTWSAVFDAYSGLPAWVQEVGQGQPDNVRLTNEGTVLTLTGERLTEYDLHNTPLLDLPMGPDQTGLNTHHDAATWGEWVYVLYNESGGPPLWPLDDGVLVMDRDGTVVADLFLPDVLVLDQPAAGDYSHANAINPTGDGDLLVSLRHQNAVLRVSADPEADDFGALRWQLVGAPIPDRASMLSDFELRSVDGALEDFMGQHDANLLPDGTLTMFDNRQYPLETSRMIDVSLDEDARVATVTHTYELGIKCPFQGGARMTRSGGRLATCASSRTVYGFGPGESESRWSLSVSCADIPAGPAYILRVHPVEI